MIKIYPDNYVNTNPEHNGEPVEVDWDMDGSRGLFIWLSQEPPVQDIEHAAYSRAVELQQTKKVTHTVVLSRNQVQSLITTLMGYLAATELEDIVGKATNPPPETPEKKSSKLHVLEKPDK